MPAVFVVWVGLLALELAGCGGRPPRFNSISGVVSGEGLTNVTVMLVGPHTESTAVDSAGSYHFSGLANGDYTVAPMLPGQVFDPARWVVAVRSASITGQDFTRRATEVSTLVGVGRSGNSDSPNVQFNNPQGLAVDPRGENLYVADHWNFTIRKITLGPPIVVSTLAGVANSADNKDSPNAQFNFPVGIAVDDSGVNGSGTILYVTDWANHSLRRIVSLSGEVTVSTLRYQTGTSGPVHFSNSGTAVNFIGPTGVAVAKDGSIYVTEAGGVGGPAGHTIRKITSAGVTTLAGKLNSAGSADGLGTQAQFNAPTGLAVDQAGYLYVADSRNHTIRKISPEGEVSTLAGKAPEPPEDPLANPPIKGDHVDGLGTEARFNHPEFLAVDGAGNVYVTETGGHTIRKITPAGSTAVVNTLAGKASWPDFKNGQGSDAQFHEPAGIVVDGSGTINIADGKNHVIRKITQ